MPGPAFDPMNPWARYLQQPQPLQVPGSPTGMPAGPMAPTPTGVAPGMHAGTTLPGQSTNRLDIPDEALLRLMTTYPEQMEYDSLEKQRELANALRYREGPEGRSYGGVYTAANPLEHIGRGIQQYKAGKRLKGIEEKQAGIRKTTGEKLGTAAQEALKRDEEKK